MNTFDFWAKEGPAITQAPHIVIPGAILIFLVGWFVARSWYAQQIETLREQMGTIRERLTLAQDDEPLLS